LAVQDPANTPPPAPESQPPAPPSAAPAQAASPKSNPPAQVNVEVQNPSWQLTPTWVAIGALGVVLLVVLIVMATRDRSNTVIRG